MTTLTLARAAVGLLEAAGRRGLPEPKGVTYYDFGGSLYLEFASVAQLAQWALWGGATIRDTPCSGGLVNHSAEFAVSGQAVRGYCVTGGRAAG